MSDQLFTTYRYQIDIDKFGEEFYIPIFSDVHRFAYNCDIDRWQSFLRFCKNLEEKNPGRVRYIGLGDYDDMASGSEREAFAHARFHDTTVQTLDDLIEKRTKEYCKELEFMKGKIIGLIEGNHHYRFQSGETSTNRMCQLLETKYLGGVSIIRIAFKSKGTSVCCMDIYAHHTAGAKGGSGRKSGSSLNKLEDMAEVWNVDLILAGHDHKLNIGFPVRMYLDGRMKVKQKEMVLVRTGSFQKGWVPDTQGYVPTFNGKANFLGAPIIKLIPSRSCKNYEEELKVKISVLAGDYC